MNEMIADQKEQEETAKPSELHAKREPFSLVSDPLPHKPAEVVRRSDVGRVSGKRVAWGSWLSTTAVLDLAYLFHGCVLRASVGEEADCLRSRPTPATGMLPKNKSESSSTADDAIEDQLKRSGNFASVRKQTLPELAEDSESSLGRVEYAPSEVSDKEEEPVTLVLPVPIAYLMRRKRPPLASV